MLFDSGLPGSRTLPPECWTAETCDCTMNQGWVVLWFISLFSILFFFFCFFFVIVAVVLVGCPTPLQRIRDIQLLNVVDPVTKWGEKKALCVHRTKSFRVNKCKVPRPSDVLVFIPDTFQQWLWTKYCKRDLASDCVFSLYMHDGSDTVAKDFRCFLAYAACSDCHFQCSISLLFKSNFKLKILGSDTSEGGHQQSDVYVT